MPGIFSRIVSGEIPCHKVAESDQFLAFLDINPLAKGHTLVIPKTEVDYIFDMDESLFKDCFSFAQKVGKAIHASIPCVKVGIAVIGLEVPHAHIHLVPLQDLHDLEFSRPKLTLDQEELSAIAAAIRDKMVY
ncbi:MAG TPA: HIT family protein [Bacteroidales bacterium]|nr:HIT family protein [Bacteroidales bacterium]HSA44530.1 HIT family protein [Bacteroidales bacterium]